MSKTKKSNKYTLVGFLDENDELSKELDEVSKKFPGIELKKVIKKEDPSFASKYCVINTPTILILKDGEEIERFEKKVPQKILLNELEMRLKNEIYYQS